MRGFNDNLPPISKKFEEIKRVFQKFSDLYCVDLIDLPLIDNANLYFRTSGNESEVCNKELFEVRRYKDKFEDWVLRPEGTAGCMRAVKDNNFLNERKIARLGYYGPMFRYNRPQKGRYRQFFHAGWEWLGSKNKFLDYEIIIAASKLLDIFGINYTLEINSIGTIQNRNDYRKVLNDFWKNDNLKTDPLKILDKLDKFDINLPKIELNKEDDEILNFILKKLEENDIKHKYNPYLIRGLDYYNGVVFEFKVNNQSILAGGRYDSLMEQLDGFPTPAIGFAMGVDRVVDLLEDDFFEDKTKIAILSLDENEYAMNLINKFRENNLNCLPYWGYDLKKGLKIISKEFRFVVIVGTNEKNNNIFILKDLKNSEQYEIESEKYLQILKILQK